MFKELLDEVKSSRLKVCFDIAHLNVYSKMPFREWADALGNKIAYVHISDNCGEKDQHLEVGQGKIDWQEFTKVIEEYQISPEIVLEQVTLEQTKKSLSYLRKIDLPVQQVLNWSLRSLLARQFLRIILLYF